VSGSHEIRANFQAISGRKKNVSTIFRLRFDNRQWLISFMTEAELEQWALLSNWQTKRIDWLRVFLGRLINVPSSRDLVVWPRVMVGARRAGRRLETADAWIAATAALYDATFITHNGKRLRRSYRP